MSFSRIAILTLGLALSACQPSNSQNTISVQRAPDFLPEYGQFETPTLEESGLAEHFSGFSKAIFAGGCFWCTEEVFQRVKGVEAVYSGYIGGHVVHPSYQAVCNAGTGHAESIVVFYDESVVSYDLLLEFFYASHDPTQVNRQGPDVGPQYRSAVFYVDDTQREKAVAYQQKLNDSGKFAAPIATEITAASAFYLAEAYHQDYYPGHQDNPYVQRISKPKVEKFTKAYHEYLKEGY